MQAVTVTNDGKQLAFELFTSKDFALDFIKSMYINFMNYNNIEITDDNSFSEFEINALRNIRKAGKDFMCSYYTIEPNKKDGNISNVVYDSLVQAGMMEDTHKFFNN